MNLCRITLATLVLVGLVAHLTGETKTWTLTNHASDYADEPVRLGVELETPYDGTRLVVKENGREVPYQLEVLEGTLKEVRKADIWVMTDIKSKASHKYTVTTGGKPETFKPVAGVMETGDTTMELRTGEMSVVVTTGMRGKAKAAPGPVGAISAGEVLKAAGASHWDTSLELTDISAEVLGDGPLFGKVRVRYEFRDSEQTDASNDGYYAEMTFTAWRGKPYVVVEESHRMLVGDAWTLDLSPGLKPARGYMKRWFKGAFSPAPRLDVVGLKPNDRLGETVIRLQPRWTQSYDEGWTFFAGNDKAAVGAMVLRAGRWHWPHENLIHVRVDESGKYAGLRCPTRRGKRYWLLLAGSEKRFDVDKDSRSGKEAGGALNGLAGTVGMWPLDKLTHEYILEWPGLEPGGFSGQFYYTNGINPTGPMRGMGRSAVRAAEKGGFKPKRSTLSRAQVFLDPDIYGTYWNRWSPINPNFYTDFVKYPVALTCQLKGHPKFKQLSRQAMEAMYADLFHSVTLPGGAGQECPGYTAHAMKSWKQLAPIAKKHLGFDPTTWPRYKAAASFLLHTSQPLGGGKRRILPLGDTHPTGPDVIALAKEFGAYEDVRKFRTEELPGFGVVFRSYPGTDRENFLAFKAGPNRGHNHGDQLSFHYCGDGKRLAIDHMCSYSPRADQEHMHNRVAFSAGGFKYANMDGYERLIAFKADARVDIAVGQVESERLRKQPRTPQQVTWNPIGPYHRFDTPLVYRRTIVMVKDPEGKTKDYFVIRDQHWGPKVTATYGLHVESGKADVKDSMVNFGSMTLHFADPEEIDVERFDWSFRKGKDGYGEKTRGVRVSRSGDSTQFITVLYPSGNGPKVESIANGAVVKFGNGRVDRIVFGDEGEDSKAEKPTPLVIVERDGKSIGNLTTEDVDLNRSQGEVGLFVPDCGYDFGPIPDWLVKQRAIDKDEALELLEKRK